MRSPGVVVAALLFAGCVGTSSTSRPAPSATVALTITTAPGDRLAFEPAEPTVQAAGPITLTFRNGSSLPHNVTFTGALTAATQTIVRPGTSDQVMVVPPAPGAYPFVCTIHDGMTGRLIVEPASAGL